MMTGAVVVCSGGEVEEEHATSHIRPDGRHHQPSTTLNKHGTVMLHYQDTGQCWEEGGGRREDIKYFSLLA